MQLTCNRCGHEWMTRSDKPPSKCSKCKSREYNKPRMYALTWTEAPAPTVLRPSSVRRRPQTEAFAQLLRDERGDERDRAA